MAKLLIVDDEKGIRAVIREYAEFSGYEVEEATNGMEAVDYFRENDADLIVMDVMMPKKALTLAPEPMVKKWCSHTKNDRMPIDDVAYTIDL